MKFYLHGHKHHVLLFHKCFLMMKITALLITIAVLQVHASGFAQKVTLSEKNTPLVKIFKKIKKQSGYTFFYENGLLKNTGNIDITVQDKNLDEVLYQCLRGLPLTYNIAGKTIVITRKEDPEVKKIIVQQFTVTGTVSDGTGGPLPGVNVKLKGTTIGTTTNVAGIYKLNLPDGTGTLVFSYIGYENQEIRINNEAHLNVVLKQQSEGLSEVVVTALGIKRSEKSLTYATQQVNGEELNRVKTDNLMNSLNGKVAGLTISPSAGGVGSSAKVILRGSRSANGTNQPLYVIDGVPITNSANANGQNSTTYGGGPDGGDGISNLNPEDIASISVLEGASAAALYGSQAQNGVILITTKSGKSGKAEINYSSSYSVDHIAYQPKFQNQYGQTTTGAVDSWGPAISSSKDNLKQFFQNGQNLTNAVNLSGGNDVAQTYFSYANTHARGVEPGNKLNRNNFNLRETARFLNNKLTVDASINYVNQQIDNSPALGFYLNPLTGLYLFPRGLDITPYKNQYEFPDQTGFDRQNWIVKNTELQQNPWWIITRDISTAKRNRVLLSGKVKYDINSWLNVQVRGNVDRTTDRFESDRYSGTASLFNGNGRGYLIYSNQVLEQKYGDFLASITVPTHSDFKIDGIIGTSITDQQTDGISVRGDLSTPNLFTPGNTIAAIANSTVNTTSNATAVSPNHSQLQAIFANANLAYKDWAFLTLTGRKDWSSNLAFTPNISYFYPSAGLSVILTQVLNLPKVISYAKLRGTYAEVGNTVPPYLTYIQNTQSQAGSLVFNTAAAFHTLKPEKTKSFELGTDMRFADNRVNFSFTYYKTNTLNQYVPIAPVVASLVSTGYVNAGNIQNTGIEFILGADVLKDRLLTWNTSINGAMNRNKVIDVDSRDNINQFFLTGSDGSSYSSALTKGGSYGDIYGITFVRDAQNRIMLNGSGTKADPYTPQKSNAATYIGNPNPKFQLGWSNSFTYQKFSFSFLVDGKFGGHVLSLTQSIMDAYGVSPATADARANGGVKINGVDKNGNAVTTVDPQTWYTAVGSRSGGISEQYIYSATVVRLREAALGYSFPIPHGAIRNVKLSLTGRNLFYFYKKAPFDPEITMSTGNGLSGVDVFNQPATRTIGLNLGVTF